MRRPGKWTLIGGALALAVGCSAGSDSSSPDPAGETTRSEAITTSSATPVATSAPPTTAAPSTSADVPSTTRAPVGAFDPKQVGTVTIIGPITGGKGAVVLGGATIDLASVGYVEEEYFISGTASAYRSTAPLTSDGVWAVEPIEPAPFTTRLLVRRPIDGAAFGGDVAVEWMNVSAGFDSSPDWSYTHTELIRSGWTWVGVTAQQAGVIGREGSVVALGMQQADPERYAALSHPGDSYSYDMFSQAGAAVRTEFAALLGGQEPEFVYAVGESQSAFRLTTYVNAAAPITNVFDGYLLHSRAGLSASLSQAPFEKVDPPDPALIRTDLSVPVFQFLSETDVAAAGLGFGRARQPDTEYIRTWEVPGTAHADTYNLGLADTDDGGGAVDDALFETMIEPPSAIYSGIISCDFPINAGPHTYVLRAAVRGLQQWARAGIEPPAFGPIDLDAAGDPLRDADGNATGGVRTPHVDAPIATLSGLGQSGDGFCGLFGTTTPFTADRLAARHGDAAGFTAAWNEAVDAAVGAGALLEEDAAQLRRVVRYPGS